MEKDCPKLKIKCSKCNRIGHNDTECSDAKKLFKSNVEILKDFDVNDEDMLEKGEVIDTTATECTGSTSATITNNISDKTPQAPKAFIINKTNLNKNNIEDDPNGKNGKTRRKNKLIRKRSNSSPTDIQPGKKINQDMELTSSRSEYESDVEESSLNKK